MSHIPTRHAGWAAPSAALLLCCSAAVLPGCRGERDDAPPHQFFPDMDDAPKWKPQVRTEFFPDGRSMRQPVEGTVPFSRWGYTDPVMLTDPAAPPQQLPVDRDDLVKVQQQVMERTDLLQEDDAFYRGVDQNGRYVTSIPMPVTRELIARGQERFNIYCSVCHGYNGSGNGMVGQRWTGLSVANFHDPKYSDPREPDQKGSDGFIFHTALNGVPNPADPSSPKMPPYRHALSERDAWAIVAYVRVLQQSVPVDHVPDQAARQRLQAERAALPPDAPSGSTGSPAPIGAPAPSAPKGQP